MKQVIVDENTVNWTISNGDFSLTTDLANYLVPKLRAVVRFFKTEWFLDISEGIDFFNKVYIKNPNLDEVADLLKVRIANTLGVKEITDFIINDLTAARQLDITFSIKSTEGETITLNEVI